MDTPPRSQVIGIFIMLVIGIVALGLLILSSCTFSVTTVHTQGEASDVVDEVQKPDVTASLNVPVKPI